MSGDVDRVALLEWCRDYIAANGVLRDGTMAHENGDPGYLADDVAEGTLLTVILPDGTPRTAVVLGTLPGGSVRIDYVDRVAQLRAEHEARR